MHFPIPRDGDISAEKGHGRLPASGAGQESNGDIEEALDLSHSSWREQTTRWGLASQMNPGDAAPRQPLSGRLALPGQKGKRERLAQSTWGVFIESLMAGRATRRRGGPSPLPSVTATRHGTAHPWRRSEYRSWGDRHGLLELRGMGCSIKIHRRQTRPASPMRSSAKTTAICGTKTRA